MDIHENVAPLAFLIGSWSGDGQGTYPTSKDFTYTETLTFVAPPGKSFLFYQQHTANPEGKPMHTEAGYLRPQGENIEFTLANPTGQTEVLHGKVINHTDGSLELRFEESQVTNTATAKPVDATARRFIINASRTTMRCEFDMAAVGQTMNNHLVSLLTKDAA